MKFKAIVAVILCALALTGCAQLPTQQPSQGEPLESSPLRSRAATPSPGIVRADGDRVTAVGTLVYERSSGEFLLINAGPKGNLSGREKVIAQIDSGRGTGHGEDLVGLVGAYIEFRGTYRESVETSITYPNVTADSLRIITLPNER